VQTSTDRILTTHTGSLPRPASLTDRWDAPAVRAAVEETVRRQRDAGLDVVNDGEVSKPDYATYVTERLSGFDGEPIDVQWPVRALGDFPEYYARQQAADGGPRGYPSNCGPVSYTGRAKVEADLASLKAAAGDGEVFMSAASPGIIAWYLRSTYYRSTEEYLFALADAMKQEYDAIYQAGVVLQVDCPDLAATWETDPGLDTEGFRKQVALRLEALDHATRDIPPDRLRMHLCWGNDEGPHHTDVPLASFADLVLAARPGAVLLEAANPRHEHEWTVFQDVKLPDGKVIIPGVLDSTTNYIEHPELVAQRLIRYAGLVGKTNVIAGTDCGFASAADGPSVDPKVAWAKLAAMAEGARLASDRLWGHASSYRTPNVDNRSENDNIG
jgi:5-methyltetrahydropteroyltriglutamate--homocysteine methyltransferase